MSFIYAPTTFAKWNRVVLIVAHADAVRDALGAVQEVGLIEREGYRDVPALRYVVPHDVVEVAVVDESQLAEVADEVTEELFAV